MLVPRAIAVNVQRTTGTIDDFSEQWSHYTEQSGYYASDEMLQDVLGPLVSLADLRGQTVAEIGCGNGRFLKILSRHAARAIGVEPGAGHRNARAYAPAAEVVNASVFALPPLPPLDHVFSLGVVHHLPDPLGALRVMHGLLKPGGRCTIWVYGKEGNELYLAAVNAMRKVTTRIPHKALHAVSTALVPPLRAYIHACAVAPLPMKRYMRDVLRPLADKDLRVVVYDQLNPSIAAYWTRAEVEALMRDAGFSDLRLHHRHGYSWTATGTR